MENNSRNLKVLSLFSGAGGMDLGFLNAGFDIIWANDFFEAAVNSYKKNISENIIFQDIRQISEDQIPNDIDVIIGGFPCQGFSIANSNRSINDQRNFLYKEMLRIISAKQPKFFVAENVKGLLSIDNGKIFEMIKSDFENLKDKNGKLIGYKVDAKVLNAAEYGVPQARERVIIIGNRLNIENPYPIPTHYIDASKNNKKHLLPAITVEQAIGFLSEKNITNNPIIISKEEIKEHIEKTKITDIQGFYKIFGLNENNKELIIKNHIAAENVSDKFFTRKYQVNQSDICDYLKFWRDKSDLTTKDISNYFEQPYKVGHWFRKDKSGSIPKVEDWWKLKKILKFDDRYDKIVTTFIETEIHFEQSLRITNWTRPSDTITATTPEIHINKMRRLSVRECAILQTFPLTYEFTGSLHQMYKQIGNAVPVLLATKIANEIKNSIENFYEK